MRRLTMPEAGVRLPALAPIITCMELRITERTFGIELELANVEKRKIYFPSDYTWDEEEVIHNTDGTRGTISARFGGEINTPPMHLCHKDLDTFRKVVESCAENGAVARRDCGVQVHIFVGDLTLDELKNIYYLTYHATDLLKDLCHLPPYSDEQRYRPSPTLEFYERVQKSQSFSELQRAFENSHNKGYVRHFVNIASYFVRGTVEFRLFNTTTDFQEIMNCIMFAYRYVDYALKHNEDDFRAIKTVEQMVSTIKLPSALPALPPSLIFFSSIREMDVGATAHSAVDLTKSMLNVLVKNTGNQLVCVNPYSFSTEVRLSKLKKLIVFNNDEFNHILYSIVRDGLRIKYDSTFQFLEDLNGDDPVKQVACLIVFKKICRYLKSADFYKKSFEAIQAAMPTTIQNATKAATRMVEFLTNCDYRLGTINDAVKVGGDVFFNFDDYGKSRTAVSALRKHSDYSESFETRATEYLNLVETLPENTTLFMVSTFPYHEHLKKIASVGDKIFYCSEKKEAAVTYKAVKLSMPSFKEPPDDLVIDDPDKLKIRHVAANVVFQLQKHYVKKVQIVSKVTFPFLVFYEDYLLGAFGFKFSKQDYDISLVTDFCTNNAIPRVSKLILLCVKSRWVKKFLSRRTLDDFVTCETKVYTHNPVSMKYRGLFKKVSQEKNHLVYTCELGTEGDFTDIIAKYKQIISRKK